MSICVLVPSEEHMAQAGVRIRYRRIERELRALGHELQVAPIQTISGLSDLAHDVYVISKCIDARALLLARVLMDSGKLVGVDLFDDYFSQTNDSRFTRLRYWLRTLTASADFILCSTPAMCELAARLAPGLAVHVMNDPASRLDAEGVRAALLRKFEYAHTNRILHIGWFGIGDNPHFPVGLTDLVAFGADLASLRGRGFDVRLSILTNQRAMTANSLAMLRRLAVSYTVEEWSEERERLLLARSLVCFLPVNAQSFSIVKSLNRAVSALCAGAQVLSSGYPLYERLAPFIYRNPRKLLDDFTRRTLTLREDTVPQFMRLMEQWADPGGEARALVGFLQGLRQRKSAGVPPARSQALVAVIHGRNTLGDVHEFALRMNALSVCSPFCSAKLNFDVRFQLAADAMVCEVLIADRHYPRLDSEVREHLLPHGKILDTRYRKLDPRRLLPGFRFEAPGLARMNSIMSITASYPSVMANIETILRHLFPGITCYYSEHATLPWAISPRAQFASHKSV